MRQNEDGEQASSSITVERKSCVSAEAADSVTFAVQSMMTPNDGGAGGEAGETDDEEEA
jgi:hypothetical protein